MSIEYLIGIDNVIDMGQTEFVIRYHRDNGVVHEFRGELEMVGSLEESEDGDFLTLCFRKIY